MTQEIKTMYSDETYNSLVNTQGYLINTGEQLNIETISLNVEGSVGIDKLVEVIAKKSNIKPEYVNAIKNFLHNKLVEDPSAAVNGGFTYDVQSGEFTGNIGASLYFNEDVSIGADAEGVNFSLYSFEENSNGGINKTEIFDFGVIEAHRVDGVQDGAAVSGWGGTLDFPSFEVSAEAKSLDANDPAADKVIFTTSLEDGTETFNGDVEVVFGKTGYDVYGLSIAANLVILNEWLPLELYYGEDYLNNELKITREQFFHVVADKVFTLDSINQDLETVAEELSTYLFNLAENNQEFDEAAYRLANNIEDKSLYTKQEVTLDEQIAQISSSSGSTAGSYVDITYGQGSVKVYAVNSEVISKIAENLKKPDDTSYTVEELIAIGENQYLEDRAVNYGNGYNAYVLTENDGTFTYFSADNDADYQITFQGYDATADNPVNILSPEEYLNSLNLNVTINDSNTSAIDALQNNPLENFVAKLATVTDGGNDELYYGYGNGMNLEEAFDEMDITYDPNDIVNLLDPDSLPNGGYVKDGVQGNLDGNNYFLSDIMNSLTSAGEAVATFVNEQISDAVEWFTSPSSDVQIDISYWLANNLGDLIDGNLSTDQAFIDLAEYVASQQIAGYVVGQVTDVTGAKALLGDIFWDAGAELPWKHADAVYTALAKMAIDFALNSQGWDAEQYTKAGITTITSVIAAQYGEKFFSSYGLDPTGAAAAATTLVAGLLDSSDYGQTEWVMLGVQTGIAYGSTVAGAVIAEKLIGASVASGNPAAIATAAVAAAVIALTGGKVVQGLYKGQKFYAGEYGELSTLINSTYQVQQVDDGNGNMIDALVVTDPNGATSILQEGITHQIGGPGHDNLIGNNLDNVISGDIGSDYIEGKEGDDAIFADKGNDHLIGGKGNDILDGGIENDEIFGDEGDDIIIGGAGHEFIHAGSGNDSVSAGDDEDIILAGTGDDLVEGGEMDDVIELGAGNDVAEAGDGDDIVLGNTGSDSIGGGAGKDNLFGELGNDQLAGGDGDDYLNGGADADILLGDIGNDYLDGGLDDDMLQGGFGDDILDGEMGDDVLIGGMDNDLLIGNLGDDNLQGDHGDDILVAGVGIDTLNGGDGNDKYLFRENDIEGTITDSSGNDTVILDQISSSNVSFSESGDDLVITYGTNDDIVRITDQLADTKIEKLELSDGYIDLSALTFNGGVASYTVQANTNPEIDYVNLQLAAYTSLASQKQQLFSGNSMLSIIGQETYHEALRDEIEHTYYNGSEIEAFSRKRSLFGGSYSVYKVKRLSEIEGTSETYSYTELSPGDDTSIYDQVVSATKVTYNNLYYTVEDLWIDGEVVSTSIIKSGGYRDEAKAGEVFTDYYGVYSPSPSLTADDRLANGTTSTVNLGEIQLTYGIDKLVGTYNAETINGYDGADYIYGGNNHDTLNGGGGNDWIFGNEGNDNITGGDGDDIIHAGSKIDTVYGGDGNDAILGHTWDDFLYGENGNDWIDGGRDNDTISGGNDNDTIYGRDGNDTLNGDAGNDLIFGGTEDDTITGGDGNDYLYGEEGDDIIIMDAGDDYINGGDGTDLLYFNYNYDLDITINSLTSITSNVQDIGTDTFENIEGIKAGSGNDEITITYTTGAIVYSGAGNDTINGGIGVDYLYGESGVDTISGGDGNDVIYGYADNDTLYGNNGNDLLAGGSGSDNLYGGSGDDKLNGGSQSDIIDGGDGIDTVTYSDFSSGVTVNLTTGIGSPVNGNDTLISIENIDGSNNNDHLTGDSNDNVLKGLDGDDTLNGEAGDDYLYGDTLGADTLNGGDGDDAIYAGLHGDVIDGGNGTKDYLSYYYIASTIGVNIDIAAGTAIGINGGIQDTFTNIESFYASNGDDIITADNSGRRMYGYDGADLLTGGDGYDIIKGHGGNDTLIGKASNDDIYGYEGDDILNGGDGSDILDGGDGIDIATYEDSTSGVTVDLTDNNNNSGGEASGDTIVDVENITGSDFNDNITGDSGNNTLSGLGGSDILTGGNGSNVYYGGAGNDTLNGGDDNDYLHGGVGDDTMYGGAGTDFFYAGAGADYMDGEAGSDRIYYTFATEGVNLNLKTNVNTGGWAEGDTIISMSKVYLTYYDDTITGTDSDEYIKGYEGIDTIFGEGGNDTIDGDGGNDTIRGGSGNDILNGGDGNDILYSDGGNDILNGGDGSDALRGNYSGADILNGDAGNDSLYGGLDGDTLDGGDGYDSLTYFYTTTGVTIDMAAQTVDGVAAGGVQDTFSNIERIYASRGDDFVYGDGADTEIHGYDGDDLIDGGAGADTLYGDGGADIFVFSDLTHSTDSAQDIIEDFVQGEDLIDLTAFSFTSISDFTISNVSGDTVVDDNSSTFSFKLDGSYTLADTDFIFT
ncbi:MAG: hypothetical protein J5I98_20825 [Phaeodactylibacter sp.]|nr:hypothetical protein [Phaeodactylibacter sp.]